MARPKGATRRWDAGNPNFPKYGIQRNNSLGRQFRLLPDTREYSS
jgi:hypothetical protein